MRLVLFILLGLPACTVQNCSKAPQEASNEQVDFNKHFKLTQNFNKDANSLEIAVALDDGFHAYAEGETVGRPIKLTISPKNGWTALGPTIIPAGKRVAMGSFGESVVIEGNFKVIQPLTGGFGGGEATLFMQICTATLCDQPRNHVITWP